MNPWLALLVGFLVGYLLGSIPTSYWAGRLLRGIDLREHGSGNLGATNVFRTLGKTAAIPVLLIDIGKGVAAVLVARLVLDPGPSVDAVPLAAALGAICGHIFSPWVAFRGGKGVATAAGAFLALAPWGGVPALAVWIILLLTTRIMSIASVAAAVVLPVSVVAYELAHQDTPVNWASLAASILGGALVLAKHRSNIRRLQEGTEKVLW